uniref:E2 ubiquitin-conjugating enzyme n=1 Tax=Xenopsylla cheopis TaxID=163159 RepID=A0A6M2DXK6_XENCH
MIIKNLPPEVLLVIFSYLDDLSLCSAASVCTYWNRLLQTHISMETWQKFTKVRWPLFGSSRQKDWFKTYTALMDSCFCRMCLTQMSHKSTPIGEQSAWRQRRLKNELNAIRSDAPDGIDAVPLDAQCCHWQAVISGPEDSPYAGGMFFLYLQMPLTYPIDPPIVRFLTKIIHPNISRHGDVGIDAIEHNWSLALTISKVLLSIQSLLTDPYTEVCMEPLLGKMYQEDRQKFDQLARQWTWKYAMNDFLCHK